MMQDEEHDKLTGDHLISSASLILGNDHSSLLLKAHYFTQCMELYNFKYKLPPNVFGPNIRCSHCCTAWSVGKYRVQVSNKISKSATKRYKNIIKNRDNSNSTSIINNAIQNLYGKRYNIRCLICTNTTIILQSLKDCMKKFKETKTSSEVKKMNVANKSSLESIKQKYFKSQSNKNADTCYQTIDSVALMPKVIQKNQNRNRKKKDKFVGLCQAACEASQELLKKSAAPTIRNDSLNLFLKPTK